MEHYVNGPIEIVDYENGRYFINVSDFVGLHLDEAEWAALKELVQAFIEEGK